MKCVCCLSINGRKNFCKIFSLYVVILIILLSVGFMGCTGRHGFTENGIVTYSVFNNKTAEYSYDEVESYSVNAYTYYRSRSRGLSYHTYNVNFYVNMSDGTSFVASYDMSRDIKALEQLDTMLGENKTINSDYLQEFISAHNFNDDEIETLYSIFDE